MSRKTKPTSQRKPGTAVIGGVTVTLGRVHGKRKQPIALLRKIVDAAIAHRKAIEAKQK